ncbi:MAG: galactitol-1-phosphate 5-dehydrogenase [Treponema sp.]|nr:galactitol-1-phosphate 5-dehydrogenase [Treponema sp.]
MKACVLHKIGQLVYEDVPDPVPKAGEVLLKIKASGICGSDIPRVFIKGTYSFPTIPGHEFAGEIVETGPGADRALIGKAAAVFPLLPCKKCDMCETGEYASCRNYNYFGSRCDGGFAQYIAVPVWNLVMAGNLGYEEMAMAEPASVSLHALGRAGVSIGDSVAIFGAGAIGLMLAAFAKAGGAQNIILLDIDEKKLAFAKQLGYEYALNSGSKDWLDNVKTITGGKGVDLAIEGAGAAAAAEGCFLAAKPLGRVVLMGNPSGDMNLKQAPYWDILRKQLTVFGTWNSSYTQKQNDWRTALAAMASGRVNVKQLVTHRFSLADCGAAFDLLRDKTQFSCRVMFTI